VPGGRTNQAKENEEKLATLKRREERQKEEAEKKRKEAELRMRQAEERRRKEEEERKAKAEEEAARVRYIKRDGYPRVSVGDPDPRIRTSD
jgi:hypothetical protein